MGEYYKWVNIDKKEYINPHDFDKGAKLSETSNVDSPVLLALAELMQERWKDDRIIFLGDEIETPERTDNEVLNVLYEQRKSKEGLGYDEEYVFEEYYNISSLCQKMKRYSRYIVNVSKEVYIDTEKLPLRKREDGTEYRVSPIPFLMAYGRMAEEEENMGIWIGDIVRFEGKRPEGYTDVTGKYEW